MSFVDVMGEVRWTEADIVNRMESMIREHCSQTEELILHRKILGSFIAGYQLSTGEQQEIGAYAGVCAAAQSAGREARVDMAILARVLDAERGVQALAGDDVDGQALLASRAARRPAAAAEELAS